MPFHRLGWNLEFHPSLEHGIWNGMEWAAVENRRSQMTWQDDSDIRDWMSLPAWTTSSSDTGSRLIHTENPDFVRLWGVSYAGQTT